VDGVAVESSSSARSPDRVLAPDAAIPPRGDAVGVGGTPQTRIGLWWEHHPRATHAVVTLALVWGTAWLVYRVGFSWRGANPIAFGALLVVEFYNLVSLAFLALAGWEWHDSVAPRPSPGRTVDVFICTYDEPRDVVEATLSGCAALAYPHTTFLLDDGRRPEMEQLAERWGARYLTRTDNAHAKAGNINSALRSTDGELIFFLDADHAPLPDALDLTVGYFDDATVALVQSPHDFYNQDSVQHYAPGRHEQSLFFEVVCPGKDRHNAAFWCGSATVVRRAALEEVGGVATETIAEDFHTTIKMHGRGWSTRYHNEVLVQGLAPVDLDGYLLQRDRWARGNLAVFRLPESPLRRSSGLDVRQRLGYFSSLLAYVSGAMRLLLFALLAASLGLGVLPAVVHPVELIVLWIPATTFAIVATVALCRGHMRLTESSHYTLVTAEIYARALRCAFLPSRTKFKVTPKEGTDAGGWPAVARLRVVIALALAVLAGLAWRILAIAGAVDASPLPGIAAPLAIALAIWELSRVIATIRRVKTRRQRRVQFRFPCLVPAVLSAAAGAVTTGTVTDIAVAGLGLDADEPVEPGVHIRLSTAVADVYGEYQFITADATVRSSRPMDSGGWRIGLSIDAMDDESLRRLITFCHVVYPYRQLRPDGRITKPAPDDSTNTTRPTPK
jgi:cellulose synthase (UDP-forming)